MFALYLELGSLIPVVQELARRGWRMKSWTTREGRQIGGRFFNKATLHYLLTNVIYTGRVNYKGEIYPGEHPRIVEDETWNRVQEQLNRNGHRGGSNVRNKYGALLKGLLRCGSCDVGMTHTYVRKDVSGCAKTLETLISLGLLHEVPSATHVVCDSCPEAHWEKVRWSTDGSRAFIPCPMEGAVNIDRERLRR